MHDDDDVCVGGGRARVLVGTRAACSVALAVATPVLAVVPRRSCWRWSSWCWSNLGRAQLRLLDDMLLYRGVQGATPCGCNGLGDRRQRKNAHALTLVWPGWLAPRLG